MKRQRVTILGATGTIGVATLDVLARHPERFEVVALTAHRQTDRLLAQIRTHRPRRVVLLEEDAAAAVRAGTTALGLTTEILCGGQALCDVAADPDTDTVMAAIVGAAGLHPALAAARAGKRVLLANKETLVLSGRLFMDAVAAGGATLLPIDSEHNAVFQVWPRGDGDARGVRRILLTASGGPFRTADAATIARATPEMALKHPNWNMGAKITIDSASMMNKGLEVIEAHWLFGMAAENIDVVVHPQSIVHSLVEYIDGSVLAQLGCPDMRTPIACALAHPERLDAGVPFLDLVQAGRLDFEAPDPKRFPCLGLAFAALGSGGLAPAVLNAANEVAVARFLAGGMPFGAIADAVARALDRLPTGDAGLLDDVLAADRLTREDTRNWLSARHP